MLAIAFNIQSNMYTKQNYLEHVLTSKFFSDRFEQRIASKTCIFNYQHLCVYEYNLCRNIVAKPCVKTSTTY